MKLKNLSKVELEAMSYDDIAYQILVEGKKKMKINDLFKKVCTMLELSEDDFINKIADFFEVISTDQRFIMLKNGFWDLKSKHSAKIILEDDNDDDLMADALADDSDDFEGEDEEKIFCDTDETEDEPDDDLKDFVIIADDDEINNPS